MILKPSFDGAFSGDNSDKNFWPTKLPDINASDPNGNGIAGIAIAWGHGATTGGCGSFHLMYNELNNNMILVNQVGTRAWSGEWSDNICTAGATYLTQGMKGAADSQTGLQPYVLKVDSKENGSIDILLNYIIKNVLGKNPDERPTLHCKRQDSVSGTSAQKQQCYSLTSKQVCNAQNKCDNPNIDWCCTWDSNGFKP